MVEPFSNRPDRRPRAPLAARGADPLDQRLDRLLSAGRQFVDGVSGARPGGRNREGRPGGRPGFEGLGRWVEDRLDWLLEEDDEWREPWQQDRPPRQVSDLRGGVRLRSAPEPSTRPVRFNDPELIDRQDHVGAPAQAATRLQASSSRSRRPLEALSRRQPLQVQAPQEDWPDPEDFQVSRWQRQAPAQPSFESVTARQSQGSVAPREPGDQAGPGRPLPRSTRRRD